MSALRDYRPSTLLVSSLCGLTTWVTLLAWTPFAEHPAGFMVPLFGAAVLVAVSGMLLRSAGLPALLVALVQVLLLLLWLHHRLAGGAALGGVVPTPDSLAAMAAAFRDSAEASRTYSAPVPVSVTEFYPLLILAGSLTAVLVDLLAAGMRRAPLAGLPLLVIYTVPISILDGGVSWVKFAAAALCFLFLIAAGEEHRLAQWGHQLTPTGGLLDTQREIGGRAVWSSARKIGFTATGLAVVAPLFVPTFSATFFGGGGGDGNGGGDGVSVTNPIVDLKRDLSRGADEDLLTVTTSDPDPSYLRISVLNTFDGNTWRPSGRDIPTKQRANGPVSKPPGLTNDVASRTFTSRLQVSESFASRWLPTPYPVASVEAPGDWRYDKATLDFISAADEQTTAGLSYRLRALVLSPTAAQLADAPGAPLGVYTPNTALPRDFPSQVRRLARSVTQGKLTEFEQAVALQQFFREDGGFRYSLERSSGHGHAALLRFLGDGAGSRVGYCEQFAAAMALMGRTLGIPSRVAVGFLRPEQTQPGTYVFSTHDLHAWPEMFFAGVGWVRFEPTPQDRTGGVPGYTTQQLAQAQAPTTSSAPSAAASASRGEGLNSADTAGKDADERSTFAGLTLLGWVGGTGLVVVLLLAPRALRRLVSRRRWAGASSPRAETEAAWAEIRDTATDLGTAWDDGLTLRTAALRLEAGFGNPADEDDAGSFGRRRGPDVNPEATSALHRLVLLLERARYARDLPADAVSPERLRADADVCVEAMRAGAGRRRRSRATWLPVSVLAAVHPRRRSDRAPAPLDEPGVDRAVKSGV